jgi:hypothetical protein
MRQSRSLITAFHSLLRRRPQKPPFLGRGTPRVRGMFFLQSRLNLFQKVHVSLCYTDPSTLPGKSPSSTYCTLPYLIQYLSRLVLLSKCEGFYGPRLLPSNGRLSAESRHSAHTVARKPCWDPPNLSDSQGFGFLAGLPRFVPHPRLAGRYSKSEFNIAPRPTIHGPLV